MMASGKLCDNCKRSGRVWCPHNTVFEIRQKLAPSTGNYIDETGTMLPESRPVPET